MSIIVTETPIASLQASALRGPARKAYDRFLDDLSEQGCAALGYRLTGPDPLPRLCVKHLRGADRVVVGFNDAGAWILLVGAHDDADAGRDVYAALYTLAGVKPEDAAKRTKPPCCDQEGAASELVQDEVDRLVARARFLTRRPRGR